MKLFATYICEKCGIDFFWLAMSLKINNNIIMLEDQYNYKFLLISRYELC